MKKHGALLLIFSWLAVGACAQVDVKCRLRQAKVLVNEPVIVEVEISNHTGETLQFGGEAANVRFGFDVEDDPGALVDQLRDDVIGRPVVIPPQQSRGFTLNLIKSYAMAKPKPYVVTARLEWKDLAFLSARIQLEVEDGLDVAQVVMGRPNGDGTLHEFNLKTLLRDRSDHLLFCVTDSQAGLSYGVYDLGTLIRLFRPVMKMDGGGQMHVLHQSGPWRYTHSVFSFNGQPVHSQFYTAQMHAIALEHQPDGSIAVTGAEPYQGSPEAPPAEQDAGTGPVEIN